MEVYLVWKKLKDHLMTRVLHRFPEKVIKNDAALLSQFCENMKKKFPNITFRERSDLIHVDIADSSKIAIKVKKLESQTDLDNFQHHLIEAIQNQTYNYGIGFGIDMTLMRSLKIFDNLIFGDSSNIILIIKPFTSKERVKAMAKRAQKRRMMMKNLALRLTQEEAKKKIIEMCPDETGITSISFDEDVGDVIIEARNPLLVIGSGVLKAIANKIQRRIAIRSDPSVRLPQEETKKKIIEMCPEEAGITSISFDEDKGEVIIVAKKPGLVIGRGGLTLRRITETTLWRPDVFRTGQKKRSRNFF